MEKKDKNSARKIGKKANFYLPVINFHRKTGEKRQKNTLRPQKHPKKHP